MAKLIGNIFKPVKDDIGYVSDPDKRAEDWSDSEIENGFARQVGLGFPVGLYLRGKCPWVVSVLNSVDKIKRPVVVQLDTGILTSFQDPFKVDADLLRLACDGKIKLFFHLPYLFDIWLPFDTSQIRWEGELVKVPMVRGYVEYLNSFIASLPENLDIDIGFVVHSGYPRWPGRPGKNGGVYVPRENTAEGDADILVSRFCKNLVWLFEPFLGGLSRKGVRGRILVENMVGVEKHPVHLATFKNCKSMINGLDKSRYGLCLDLCHAWSAGESLLPEDLETETIGLIHMNGGPANAVFGSRKDLHGYTELATAVKQGTAYPWIRSVAFDNFPIVFERKLYSVMLKDSAWLAGERA